MGPSPSSQGSKPNMFGSFKPVNNVNNDANKKPINPNNSNNPKKPNKPNKPNFKPMFTLNNKPTLPIQPNIPNNPSFKPDVFSFSNAGPASTAMGSQRPPRRGPKPRRKP